MPQSANAPQISVILPVRNGGPRLEPCLDALLSQSAESIEVIAVEDGSTDSTPAVLDRYAASDPRLRVVHQANSGVWTARLTGISLARGAWLGFCDADDLPHPDLYSSLLAAAKDNHAQMAVCAFRRMDARTGDLVGVEMAPGTAALDPRRDPVGFASINTALWNKLFDMDVVRSSLAVQGGAGLEKPRLMEDMILIASMANRIGTVGFVNEPLYDYFVHPASSMRTLSVDDARTVAEWLSLIRAGTDDEVRAAIDVMAFVHLGVSALDNLVRTASRHQLSDYMHWVRTTLKRDFPRFTAPAETSNSVVLRLVMARRLFRMGCLLPAIRLLDWVSRRTHREVKW